MTGTSTAGTGTGGPSVMTCQYECASNDDCMASGMDIGLICGTHNFCLSPCSDDVECKLFGSTECTTNMECAEVFQGVCVDFGDPDFCVAEEDPMTDCTDLNQTAIDVTDVDGATVTVCSPAPGATCGVVNGDITCAVPTTFSCEFCPEAFSCDEDAETCKCGTTADCAAAVGSGECIDGVCIDACESDDDCDAMVSPFDGGGYVCK